MGRRQGEAAANRRSKVTSERVALLVLSGLLAAAAIVIYRLSFDNYLTKKYLQTLKDENEAMRKNLTDKLDPKCERFWELHGGKCYYFSSNALSWKESRDDCESREGVLVKIDSREEQRFLEETVRKKMKDNGDRFWIGLTDSVEEGKWVWVDGSPLSTSSTFWRQGEPTNWTGENSDGEHCAMMGERGEVLDLKSWHDKACNMKIRRICEKSSKTGL
ncbi:hepatic lectin-like [Channa argus]|uniref:hepatic lectin-like n=1 Tax=Channa argus TaxID=215402 RepID=UPI003522ED04